MGNSEKQIAVDFARYIIEMPNNKLESKSIPDHYDFFMTDAPQYSHSPTELDTLSHLPRLTLEEYGNATSLQIDDYNVFEDLPEFDTLQEGDWFQGTEEQYQQVLKITKHDFPGTFEYGMMFFGCAEYEGDSGFKNRIPSFLEYSGTNKLTPEEFLRRAENTFKTK